MSFYVKAEFEVGDWVLLTEPYKKELKLQHGDIDYYISLYEYPQEILDIREDSYSDMGFLFAFSAFKKTRILKGQFRKATELEIKKIKIKNMF